MDGTATFQRGVGFGEGSKVVLGPGDVGVSDVVFGEFVGTACLVGECSALSLFLKVLGMKVCDGGGGGVDWWGGGSATKWGRVLYLLQRLM